MPRFYVKYAYEMKIVLKIQWTYKILSINDLKIIEF